MSGFITDPKILKLLSASMFFLQMFSIWNNCSLYLHCEHRLCQISIMGNLFHNKEFGLYCIPKSSLKKSVSGYLSAGDVNNTEEPVAVLLT